MWLENLGHLQCKPIVVFYYNTESKRGENIKCKLIKQLKYFNNLSIFKFVSYFCKLIYFNVNSLLWNC